MKEKKILCLCLYPSSLSDLNTAVKCFFAQTYSKKELLILVDSLSTISYDALDWFGACNIHVVKVSGGISRVSEESLSEVKRIFISMEAELVSIWSAEDWHHRDRLTEQYSLMVAHGKTASAGLYSFLYDKVNHSAYISSRNIWPRSLVCKKEIVIENLNFFLGVTGKLFYVDECLVRLLSEISPYMYPYYCIQSFRNDGDMEAGPGHNLIHVARKLPDSHFDIVKKCFESASDVWDISERLTDRDFLGSVQYVLRRGDTLL